MAQYIHALDVTNKQVRPINCDSSGNLQVDIVNGGDASAANQVTAHGKIDAITSALSAQATATKQTTIASSLGNIETDIAEVEKGYYSDNGSVGSGKGILLMGENPTNKTKVVQVSASGEVNISNSALTELAAAINSSRLDVNTDFTRNQVTVASASAIGAGSNSNEIDMNGYRHLHVYGTSSVNFGSLCVVNRQSSGGTDYLDGAKIFSASDPSGGSTYYFSYLIENVGARYLAFRNLSSSSQTVTLYGERLK